MSAPKPGDVITPEQADALGEGSIVETVGDPHHEYVAVKYWQDWTVAGFRDGDNTNVLAETSDQWRIIRVGWGS